MRQLTHAIAVVVLSVLTTECSESPSPPDVKFLASDAYFTVGGQRIVIPAVAIRSADHTFDLSGRKLEKSLKERLTIEASDPSNPMKMDKLDLSVRQYQYAGEHVASSKICPLLTRTWSQSLCRGEHRGLLKRLPEKFDLLDRAKLDLLRV